MMIRFLAVMLVLSSPAAGQGFAGLGAEAEGFAEPRRGRALAFPADHGAHPAFRIEWWYLTANLQGADGTPYGAQWTLFRTALRPATDAGWSSPQLWMGHAAVTTPDAHFSAERLARGGVGQAGVALDPFTAWIDEWRMVSEAEGASDPLDALALAASGEAFAYDLSLRADGPLVRHGEDGYSVKSAEGQASHYYSQPFYAVSGALSLPGGEVAVSGRAWLDREWSSQPLSATQEGWDWVSLHLEGGEKLMAFRLRQSDGTRFTSGTWITARGEARPFGDGAVSLTPLERARVAGRRIPTRWRVELPERGVDVTVSALNPYSWMSTRVPYWEGPVSVSGSHGGRGYLEMTGYGD